MVCKRRQRGGTRGWQRPRVRCHTTPHPSSQPLVPMKLVKRQPLHRVAPQQAVQQGGQGGGGGRRHGRRQRRAPRINVAQQGHVVAAAVGGHARHQLVQDGAHRPHVGLGVVPLVAQNFGGHVEWGPAERVGQVWAAAAAAAAAQDAGKAKVCNLEGGARGCGGGGGSSTRPGGRGRRHEQQVVRLQVSVHNAPGSQRRQSRRQLHRQRTSRALGQGAARAQEGGDVAPRTVFSYDENSTRRPHHIEQLQDVRGGGARLQGAHLALDAGRQFGGEAVGGNFFDRGARAREHVRRSKHRRVRARPHASPQAPGTNDAGWRGGWRRGRGVSGGGGGSTLDGGEWGARAWARLARLPPLKCAAVGWNVHNASLGSGAGRAGCGCRRTVPAHHRCGTTAFVLLERRFFFFRVKTEHARFVSRALSSNARAGGRAPNPQSAHPKCTLQRAHSRGASSPSPSSSPPPPSPHAPPPRPRAGHVIVLDAGSTGTRAHVYAWNFPARIDLSAPPVLTQLGAHRAEPGLSSLDADAVGDALAPLLATAKGMLPSHAAAAATQCIVLATAGLRALPRSDAAARLAAAARAVAAAGFAPGPGGGASLLMGAEEAALAWLAANEAVLAQQGARTGRVTASDTPPSAPTTTGIVEMGGASLQVAFEIGDIDADGRIEVPDPEDSAGMGVLTLPARAAPPTVTLYVRSFEGLGREAARAAARDAAPASQAADPCVPGSDDGGGDFARCRRAAAAALRSVCARAPPHCALPAEAPPRPPPPLGGLKLRGVEIFKHTVSFLKLPASPSLRELATAATTLCAATPADLASAGRAPSDAEAHCFGAALIVELLTSGFGLPMDARPLDVGVEADGEPAPEWATAAAALVAAGAAGGRVPAFGGGLLKPPRTRAARRVAAGALAVVGVAAVVAFALSAQRAGAGAGNGLTPVAAGWSGSSPSTAVTKGGRGGGGAARRVASRADFGSDGSEC